MRHPLASIKKSIFSSPGSRPFQACLQYQFLLHCPNSGPGNRISGNRISQKVGQFAPFFSHSYSLYYDLYTPVWSLNKSWWLVFFLKGHPHDLPASRRVPILSEICCCSFFILKNLFFQKGPPHKRIKEFFFDGPICSSITSNIPKQAGIINTKSYNNRA